MVVMQPIRGYGQFDIAHPYSRTGVLPNNQAMVAALKQDTREGPLLQVTTLNGGLGSAAGVPEWALWAAGGLAVGAIAGLFFFRKK